MPNRVPMGLESRLQNAALGAQDQLILHIVPSTAAGSLVGLPLKGQTLTVAGDYKCLVPLSGIVDTLEAHVKATFASGGVTLGGPDSLYYVEDSRIDTGWTVKTAGTGDGALTTTVLKTGTLTGMLGEQFAVVTITIASSTSALFTQAEYNGF